MSPEPVVCHPCPLCAGFEEDGVSFLTEDVALQCTVDGMETAEWARARYAAAVVIAIVSAQAPTLDWPSTALTSPPFEFSREQYPLGMLLLMGAFLFATRKAIRANRPTYLSTALSFLYREYRTAAFWWELMEMVRRLVLVGFFVLLRRGSMEQLILALLVCLVYLLVQTQASPYRKADDNTLAICCSFALCVLFCCMIVYRVDALTTGLEVQAGMSVKEVGDFSINTLVLTIVLFVTFLLSLAVSIALLVQRLGDERRKAEIERLTSLARRLRYVQTYKEVHAPPRMGEDWFHLFLSHVCTRAGAPTLD